MLEIKVHLILGPTQHKHEGSSMLHWESGGLNPQTFI